MDEMEMIRLMRELTRLLQSISMSEEEEEGDMEGRFEEIKRELGSWFIDGYRLYQAS